MPVKKKGKTADEETKEKRSSKMDTSPEGVREAKRGGQSPQHEVRYPGFDLGLYILQYTGRGRIHRLKHIACHCPDVREKALKMMIQYIKEGIDDSQYNEALGLAEKLEVKVEPKDTTWTAAAARKFNDSQKKLDKEFDMAKRNELRSQQRSIMLQQAALYYNKGDFPKATQKYNEAAMIPSDSSRETLEDHMAAVKAAIASNSLALIDKHYRAMIRRKSDMARYPQFKAQIHAAYGLWNLFLSSSSTSDYSSSTARAFLQVSKDLGDSFNEVLTTSDVVSYACLSALASLPRSDIRKYLETDEVRKLLEVSPRWIGILQSYLQSKYGEVFRELDDMKKDFLLDPFLYPHVNKLYVMIKEKAIMQYFQAFSTIKLQSMAEVMGLSVPDLQSHVANLIGDGRIDARIDSADKVVYGRSTDQRNADYVKALKTGELLVSTMKTSLMRMSLTRNKIVVQTPKGDDGDGGGMIEGGKMDTSA